MSPGFHLRCDENLSEGWGPPLLRPIIKPVQMQVQPDYTKRMALHWFALTTLVFWLATLRGAFDGPSYQWGLFGLGGRGLTGDYWFPAVGTLAALVVIGAGWQRRSWALRIVAIWSVLLFTAVVVAVALSGVVARFEN